MNNHEIRVIGSNNSNNNAILSMNNYGEYSNYLSRYSGSDLQMARNKIYDLLYILYPIYESVKRTNDPFRNFKRKLNEIMNLDSDLIYVLNYFYQEITPGEIPDIPQNELSIITEPITTLLLTFNNYIDTEYNRNASYTALENAKNKFYEKLYLFIKLIIEDTTFLRSAYYAMHVNGAPERYILRNTQQNEMANQILAQPNIYNQEQLAQNFNNNENINMEQLQQIYNQNFERINKNKLFNNLNTNIGLLNVNNSSPTSTINTSKCTDATMYTENNIDLSSTKIYIADQNNRIIRIYCLDNDAFNAYFRGTENIVYECKDHVPNSSLSIKEEDIIHKPYRRLGFEFDVYVLESQAKKIEKGGSYILKNTMTPLGRLASHYVVLGGNLVGALHCQPARLGNYIYNVKKYGTSTGGYKRKSHKTQKINKRNKKYRNKKQTRVKK